MTRIEDVSGKTTVDAPRWLRRPQALFAGGSLIAAMLALFAECCGSVAENVLLAADVLLICAWTFLGRPTLAITVLAVATVTTVFGLLGGTPEPAFFQPIVLAVAVGWRMPELHRSLGYAVLLAIVPPLGAFGPDNDIGWWNWSIGTLFTWTLGRLVLHLDLALAELSDARARLVAAAALEERRRIARDVHDLVGHSLTAMLLNVRAARQALEGGSVQAAEALDDAVRIGKAGLADVRASMIVLRESPDETPAPADHASLPDGASIVELLERPRDVSVSLEGDAAALHGPLAVATYRIVQECLTNIARHAASGSATLALRVDDEAIRLRAENAIARERPRGERERAASRRTLGLTGMRERVASLGGSITARRVGARWRVECEIPRR